MKIQIASDLHLEFLQGDFAGELLITPHPDADVLVLAGDIASGTQVIDLFARWPVPVVYVAGNHEFYGRDIDDVEAHLRHACEGTQIYFLEQDSITIDGCRFLGATLWTDYALNLARGVSVDASVSEARMVMMDHKVIRYGGFRFAPVDALIRHEASLAWLKHELEQPFDGPTVAITHHGVHPLSVHPRYANEAASASFVSDLGGAALSKAALWIHGHVHDSFDYRAHGTRVIANPRGYALNHLETNMVSWLRFENEAFDPMKLVEVAT